MLKRWLAEVFYVTPVTSLFRAMRDMGLVESDAADVPGMVAAVRGAMGAGLPVAAVTAPEPAEDEAGEGGPPAPAVEDKPKARRGAKS